MHITPLIPVPETKYYMGNSVRYVSMKHTLCTGGVRRQGREFIPVSHSKLSLGLGGLKKVGR